MELHFWEFISCLLPVTILLGTKDQYIKAFNKPLFRKLTPHDSKTNTISYFKFGRLLCAKTNKIRKSKHTKQSTLTHNENYWV